MFVSITFEVIPKVFFSSNVQFLSFFGPFPFHFCIFFFLLTILTWFCKSPLHNTARFPNIRLNKFDDLKVTRKNTNYIISTIIDVNSRSRFLFFSTLTFFVKNCLTGRIDFLTFGRVFTKDKICILKWHIWFLCHFQIEKFPSLK